jgi:peptidoglycan/xylan/chitin deacetylase (PgdA/CDA1 family)
MDSAARCGQGWRSSGNVRPRWRPVRRSRTVVALTTVALLSMLLAACAETAAHTLPTAVGTKLPQPTATATATPTTDPLAARNAALGCAPHAPAPQPRVVYTGLRPGAPGPAPKEVALTFDDGPTPTTSPPIYTFLEQSHIPATFFDEGQYVHEWPYLLQREWNDGFAIAVHTWDHPLMSRLSATQVHHEFADTLTAIHDILGPVCVWLWRPPYADYNDAVLKAAADFGLTTVTWDDSSADWTRPGAQQIVNNVLSQMHPGAIVLMHDGPALREQTAAALPQIVAGLKARGLVPVTLPRLLADGQYSGVSVSGASSTANIVSALATPSP